MSGVYLSSFLSGINEKLSQLLVFLIRQVKFYTVSLIVLLILFFQPVILSHIQDQVLHHCLNATVSHTFLMCPKMKFSLFYFALVIAVVSQCPFVDFHQLKKKSSFSSLNSWLCSVQYQIPFYLYFWDHQII